MTHTNNQPTPAKNRDIYLDAVKGFLILCIVLEHNTLLTSTQSWIRPFADAFAAGCFLIFTFSWPLKTEKLPQFCDKHLAYWWPFIVFITVTSILNFIIYSQSSSSGALVNYVNALLLASPSAIKESTGFMYFWFLPCLCFLYLIRLIASKLKVWFFLISIPAWLYIGVFNDETLVATPFSLHVVAFIFFIGQLFSLTKTRMYENTYLVKIPLIILFVALSVASYFIGWELFLAGGNIPSINEPLLLLFYSLFMLVAIPSVYHIAHFLPRFLVKALAYLGDNSLVIYLLHPLFYVVITQIIPVVNNPLLSFLLTILLCLVACYFMKKVNIINQLIFPCSLSNLTFKGRVS